MAEKKKEAKGSSEDRKPAPPKTTRKVAKKASKKTAAKAPPKAKKTAAKTVANKATKPAAKKATKSAAKKATKTAESVRAKTVKKVQSKTTAKRATKKQAVEEGLEAADEHLREVAEAVADPDLEAFPDDPPIESFGGRPPEPDAKKVKKQPMTAFIKKQQQNLWDLRDQLMDTMYGIQQETLRSNGDAVDSSGSGEHTGDAGSDAYDRDFALNLLAQEHDALEEIEAALERIDAGTYGICGMSGEKIPKPRLEAIPFARLTVGEQTKWEEKHGKTKFRASDDAYGFSGG